MAVPAPVDDALRSIGAELLAAARAAPAHGLAAAHIGQVAPVAVISGSDGVHQVLYNPRIVRVAQETARGEEGSVSLPGVQVEIDRPVWAEIAWDDEAGLPQTGRLDGFAARVAIHEIEQVHGTFFLQRLSRLKRDMLLRKLAKR